MALSDLRLCRLVLWLRVLDDRNRLIACERAGVTPRFEEWRGEDGLPTAYVMSKNRRRRHLTPGQGAVIALAKPKYPT